MFAAVNFHYIRNEYNFLYPGINGTTPDKFESQLKRLAKTASFVGQHAIRETICNGVPLPEKSILITFDDGLKEQFTHAFPILERLNIPFVCFINSKTLTDRKVLIVHKIHLIRTVRPPNEITASINSYFNDRELDMDLDLALQEGIEHYKYDTPFDAQLKYLLNFELKGDMQEEFVNKLFEEVFPGMEEVFHDSLYMNRAQVKILADKGFIGAHGHDHLPIGILPEEMQTFQVTASKEILEEISGQEIFGFSYPYGGYQACNGVGNMLQKAGFKFALTMERSVNCSVTYNPFYLSRFDNNDMPGGKAYKHGSDDFFNHYPTSSWVFN